MTEFVIIYNYNGTEYEGRTDMYGDGGVYAVGLDADGPSDALRRFGLRFHPDGEYSTDYVPTHVFSTPEHATKVSLVKRIDTVTYVLEQ